MKDSVLKSWIALTALLFSLSINAQVGIGTTTPDASAELDVTSTDKGVLIPRMTTGQRSAIPSPATGLMVFDNTTASFWYWDGAAWAEIGTDATSQIADADDDTKIQVEESADEDIIRFDVAGTEHLTLEENANGQARLDFLNNNFSTYVGELAGENSSGASNTAVGHNALRGNFSGSSNSAYGAYSMALKDSLSSNNTAVGYASLYQTAGSDNVSMGHFSMFNNTDGARNTSIGKGSLQKNITGVDNVAIGFNTLNENLTNRITAVGSEALANNTQGFGNTAVGFSALNQNTTGLGNTSIGNESMLNNMVGSFNLAAGTYALEENTSGSFNTAVGRRALEENTSADYNAAFGYSALSKDTTGRRNTAVGYNAIQNVGLGNENTAIGSESEIGVGASNATAVGANALASTSNSLVLGNGANVGIGTSSPAADLHVAADGEAIRVDGSNPYLSFRTGGSLKGYLRSTANWMELATAGGSNGELRFATNAADRMTIKTNGSVGIGTTSPSHTLDVSGSIRAQSNMYVGNLFYIGTEVLNDAGSNKIGISSTILPLLDDSYDLGTSSARWDDVYATNGTINTSDRRDKTNIQDLKYGLEDLMQLRPVSYEWKERTEDGEKLGLIAQELQEIVPEVVKTHDWEYNEETGEKTLVENARLGVYYSDLIPVLIKSIQELAEQNEKLIQRLEALEKK